jgi:uncharacterized tellurite resistance protein B-like protein
MSIRKLFGLEPAAPTPGDGDTETVRRITAELEAMEPEKARYLAAFAFVLARVAHADFNVSPEETRSMEEIVQRYSGLSQAQAVLVVQIAKSQATLFGATEDFLVTRQFRVMSTPDQREELLHCLFAVSAADDSISSLEETLARQIAAELGISDREFIALRSNYNDNRRIMKDLPGGRS